MICDFSKICIIGSGIIGGSIAKKLSSLGADIIGISSTIPEDFNLYYSDFITTDNILSIPDADLFILSSPLSTYDFWIKNLPSKTILECGSVKVANMPDNIIKTHPIAGSEKSGFVHSNENLFLSKNVIISHDMSDINKEIARNFWTLFSPSNITFMSDEDHNRIYSCISHFPQLLCFGIKKLLQNIGKYEYIISLEKYKSALRLMDASQSIWVNHGEIFHQNQQYINDKIGSLCHFVEKTQDNPNQTIEDFLDLLSYTCLQMGSNYKSYAGNGFNDFTSIAKFHNEINKEYAKKLTVYINEIMDI